MPAFAGDGSNLLGFLPSNTKMVFGVDVAELRGAPIFAQASSLVSGMSEYQEFVREIGGAGVLDPLNSIQTLVVASPHLDPDDAEDETVVLIEATFDAAALDTAMVADPQVVRATSGTVITYTESDQMLAVLGPNLIAAGHTTLVTAVVAAHGGGDGGLGSTLRSPARAAAGGTVWFASRAPSAETRYNTVHGRVSISNAVSATVTATTESPEAAAALVQTFNTEVATVASNPQFAAFGLGGVLNGLSATASENQAVISASIDATTWTALSTMAIEVLRSEL